jgi:hypothetical protein
LLDSTRPTRVSVLTATSGAGSAPGADVTDPAAIRVLIVDDHAVARMRVKTFFDHR